MHAWLTGPAHCYLGMRLPFKSPDPVPAAASLHAFIASSESSQSQESDRVQRFLSHVLAQVMTVVKALVKSGITICATIHSPTPYCFNLFDTLMILLRGHVVYFGENGAAA